MHLRLIISVVALTTLLGCLLPSLSIAAPQQPKQQLSLPSKHRIVVYVADG